RARLGPGNRDHRLESRRERRTARRRRPLSREAVRPGRTSRPGGGAVGNVTRSVSLGTRLLLASIVFVVLVVAVFAPLVIAVLNLRESTEREASAQNRTVATLTLEKHVLDIEGGTRSYVI